MNDNSKRRQADIRRAIRAQWFKRKALQSHIEGASLPKGFAESLAPGTLKPLPCTATPGRRQCYNVRRAFFDPRGKLVEQVRLTAPKGSES